jgi:hypothetical protein
MRCRHKAGRARRHGALLVALLSAGVGLAVAPDVYGRAGSCQPVRIVGKLTSLDRRWRDALDALARATAQEGLPWSCPGGSITLTPEATGGAVITVTDARGQAVSRRVAGPDELVPTGEALLASPLEESAPPARDEAPPAPVAPALPADPRAQIQVLIGPRASGPGAIAWGSALGRVQLPLGPWSLGFWTRYDLHLAGPSGPWMYFRTSAFSAALSVGRRIVSQPFELRATLDPSIAVVIMEAGSEDVPHPQGAKPALRLGTSLSGLFPINGVLRGVVSLDGEFAPAGLGGGLRNIDTVDQPPQLPPVPVYTAGLLLGIEASIR